MSTAEDLRTLAAELLHAAGEGTYSPSGVVVGAWPIHFQRTPASPDEVLVVSTYIPGGRYRHGLQVRARSSSTDATTAADKAAAVRRVLHGLSGLTRGDTIVSLLTFASEANLGQDKNSRDEVTVNFVALTSDPVSALDHD